MLVNPRLFAVAAAVCASVTVLARHAAAQAFTNPWAVAPVFAKATQGRIDVVGIGDSNQVFSSAGWDEAWARVLSERYGLYATGLLSAGENQGNGNGVGWNWNALSQASQGVYEYTNAPEPLNRRLNAYQAGLSPLGYLYKSSGTAPGSVITGAILQWGSAVDTAGALRMHYTYGLFPGSGAGSFQPVSRIESGNYAAIAVGPVISTRTGTAEHGVASGYLEIPPLNRGSAISIRFGAPGYADVQAPFLGYYLRMENTQRPRGAAFHTLYAKGGQSARDMAAAIRAASDETLTLYFSEVRKLQESPVRVLVRINTGVNDRAEELGSVLTNITPGWSGPAFRENIQAIINRLNGIWSLNGWAADELYFLITPSHPVSSPNDAYLEWYGVMSAELANSNPRTAAVRFSLLTTEAEMLQNSWYQWSGTDRFHLTNIGAENLARRELAGLAAQVCNADFNRDGDTGTDSDIEAFFACLAGNCCPACGSADFNLDGDVGTDADIEAFFRALAGQPC